MLVVDVIGDQIVLAYLRMGLVMVLYVVVSVSFCFPQLVPESALSTLVVLCALILVCLICSMNVSLGSSVSPSVLGCVVVGIGMLLIWSRSCVLYSDESGVKRVEVDLSRLSWRSFCVVQSYICWRYGCMLS